MSVALSTYRFLIVKTEGEGREGKGRDGKGRAGKGREGKGAFNEPSDMVG